MEKVVSDVQSVFRKGQRTQDINPDAYWIIRKERGEGEREK